MPFGSRRFRAVLAACLAGTVGSVPCAWAATAATPPSIVVPAGDTDGVYTVSWEASATPGAAYELQEATNATFAAGLRTAYAGTALSKLIKGRAPGNVYYYRVRATATGLTPSGWRTAANGCAVPGTRVAKPASLTVPVRDPDGSYQVRWEASADSGVVYQLQEARDAAFTVGLLTAYTGPALSCDLAGRAPDAFYYYRVRAQKTGYRNSTWRVTTNGCAVSTSPLSLVGRWVWTSDSDGSAPVAGAEIALVFFGNGTVDLNAFMPAEEYHDRGTYSIGAAISNAATLTMNLPDFGVALNGDLVSVANNRLKLPFMVLSVDPGTSKWKKQAPPAIDSNDFVAVAFQVYEAALLNGASDDAAADAAAHALEVGVFAPDRPVAAAAAPAAAPLDAAPPVPLKSVRLSEKKAGLKLVTEKGRTYYVLLKPKSLRADEFAAQPAVNPLTPGYFAGDPRTQLLMAPSSGPNDPATYTAALLFPMNTQVAYRKGKYYKFSTQGEDPAVLQRQLVRAGYNAAKIHSFADSAVTPKTIADELLRHPGVFYISTHGIYMKATTDDPADVVMVTGARVPPPAPGQTFEESLSAAVLALGLPSYLESTIFPIPIKVDRLTEVTFLGIGGAFFEALRANNPGWNMSRSLVYLDACSSTSHEDGAVPLSWDMLGQPAALLGWREPSDAFVSVRYSQHFFKNAVRKTHSAREIWDETWRVLTTRYSIYAEDSLLDDPTSLSNRKCLVAQNAIFEAFGSDGKPYPHLGDGLYPDTQPTIVFWLVWLGRWNQNPDKASANLQSCYDTAWQYGLKGLGQSAMVNAGYVGNHTPTANEVKEARQLINGSPTPITRGRWTLADKLPYAP